ncbi:hypothetical protein Tco_0155183 [Tanacetum coccineum]
MACWSPKLSRLTVLMLLVKRLLSQKLQRKRMTKPSQASKGKRIKTSAKGDKPAITKSKGLTILSEVALLEAEQMKLATKKSLKEFHISHASGSGDGVDILLKTFSQGEDEEEDEEHESDDDNDDNDDEDDGDEDNGELYGDLNINLSRSDAEMTDAQTKPKTEEAQVTLTTEPPVVQLQSSPASSDLVAKFINPSSDTGINSSLNPNAAVFVTRSSATIIPQTPIPIIQPQQQTHDSITTTTIPITTMPEIPNFASLFGFERRVSSLESNLSELKKTNQFAKALSYIPGVVDKYLASKVKDTVDVVVQLKSDKLREEAQAENQDFLNSLDSNMKRIIKEQTSYAVASSLSELELKKILMDKMEENNSIDRSDVQKNLYRALLEAYNSDKDLLSSYGEVVTLKRGRDDQDKDEEPSAGSNRGSKRQRSGKEESSKEATQKKSKSTSSSKGTTRSPPKSSCKSVQEEEHDPRVDDLEEPFHQRVRY